MATKLPPPPTHMQPGSPTFTEWFRLLTEYIARLADRPNFAISVGTLPGSYCCIPIIETVLRSVKVEERSGDILSIVFYCGSWQDVNLASDDYDYYLTLKRNGVTKKILRGGHGRSGWDGNDRNIHGILYHIAEDNADATWSVTIKLDSINGSYPTVNGAGLVVQVR